MSTIDKAPGGGRSLALRPLAFALPAVALLALLAFISLLVGVSDVSVSTLLRLFSHNDDDMATQVDDVIDEGIPDTPGSVGRTAWSAPAPFFSDEMRF